MRHYRRNREGRVFFFTVVTHERRPILTTELGRQSLRSAIDETRETFPFEILAIVLLPDHLHAVWELPADDADYSVRWRRIKSRFTRTWLANGGTEGLKSRSRRSAQERAIWQRRFYEHTCRDEADLKRRVDYVHVNPLKHRLVERVIDWRWSSFHRYVSAGEYPPDWGTSADFFGDEFKHAE
jgi:putative transposase